jgi:multidrug efflux pump subunit AcrB
MEGGRLSDGPGTSGKRSEAADGVTGESERVMEEHPELSPADATKKAMAEITAPIIAITLVLLSVFVPVAFILGISGELFRQFAITVAVSMFLSAINALTLSPALCGVLLRPHHGPRRGVIGMVMRSIDRVRDGYGAVKSLNRGGLLRLQHELLDLNLKQGRPP